MEEEFKLTDEFIESMMDYMREHAIRMFDEHGEVTGMIHAISKNGENALFPMLYSSEFEKAQLFAVLKHVFEEQKVIAFCMLTEAWTLKIDKEEADKKGIGRPSDSPDRQEALIIQFVSHDMVQMKTYPMLRNLNGDFKGLDVPEVFTENTEDGASLGGTILDLLPDRVLDATIIH